ncbi:EamA family transporter [Candidatus Saccharibacteria bacterium]|nr:EamA family transporter [Candidatus Saccharibacteria bacterium]
MHGRSFAYTTLLLTAAIWGVAGPVIKFTLGGIATLNFLTYRFAISAALALLSVPFGGLRLPKDRKTLALVALYGFLTTTVALGLLFLGLEKTTVLEMTFLTLIGPLLIVTAGALFLREHVTRREKTGIAIALVGVILTTLEPILRNGASVSQVTGNLLIILYLLANTASAVLVKRLMRAGIPPVSLTNFSFIIGFLTILPLSLLGGGLGGITSAIRGLDLPYHLGVLYMAALSGNLAYALWARAQRTIEIGEAALFSYLYPVFAAPLAILWLGEKITLPFVAGAVIISLGVFIAEYRSSLRKPKT